MFTLPKASKSLLIRTDFSNDMAWRRLLATATTATTDGCLADIDVVDDRTYEGADWPALRSAIPANDEGAAVLFVADDVAVGADEHPVLVVDLDEDSDPFRCVVAELWGVDNNLNLANMGWEEFAEAVDADGVFRGFKD